jgi:SAM-dependent methyltransferase
MSLARVDFSNYYDNPINDFLFRWVDYRKVQIVRKELERSAGGLLVDFGSGNGKLAASFGYTKTVCVDGNQSLVEACRNRGLKAVAADLDKPLPFEDASIEFITCVDVIEHIANPREFIRELKRLVAPGGRIIIFTPRYDSVKWILAERFHHLVTKSPSDHLSPFTKESLERLIGSNFQRFRIGTTNFNMSLFAIVEA